MSQSLRAASKEIQWQQRLFGVACDAEEAERWLEAFCVFQHLCSLSEPDVELRLRLSRAALHVGEFHLAEEQSIEIDRLLIHDPPLRAAFGFEAAVLRFKLQKLAWDRYAADPSNLD